VIKLIFKFFFLLFLTSNAFANDNFIYLSDLKKQSINKVVFLRHALAPGNGDPLNFNVNDCSTQRNLDHVGIAQSKMIGQSFQKLGIKFTNIYSSFWCRCKDTIINMKVGKFRTHEGLNSFYESYSDKDITLRKLRLLINSFDETKGPYLLVTHYVNILAFTGLSTSSGGMVAFDLNSKESIHIKLND